MYTVLVCDDDRAILESVRIYLANEGYAVLTAADGEEAMDLLEENPEFNIFENQMRIYSNSNMSPSHYIGNKARVGSSLVCNGCTVLGTVRHSIISTDVFVGDGAVVERRLETRGNLCGLRRERKPHRHGGRVHPARAGGLP